MSRILLDTNIISEIAKPRPDQNVVKFLSVLPEIWVSSLTLHELEYGILRLPDGKKKTGLKQVIDDFIAAYDDCILPIGRLEAMQSAFLRVKAGQEGRVLHLPDSLIAGTAALHDLTIATRNVSDFTGLDIELVNPWD